MEADFYRNLRFFSYIVVGLAIPLAIIMLLVARNHRLWPLLIIGALLSIPLVPSSILLFQTWERTEQQKRLADTWGMTPWQYEYPMDFPLGYYRATLPKGMLRSDVQRAMRGYVRVMHCTPEAPYSTLYTMQYEVYYFYSDRDDRAERIEIDYDKQRRLYSIRTDGGCCAFYRIPVDDRCAPGMFDD